jgi:PAS domain S-box-containing protein
LDLEKTLQSLETIVDQGITTSGQSFFDMITKQLSTSLKADVVFIGELLYPDQAQIRTASRCINNQIVDNKVYDLKNTPCEEVVGKTACSFPDNVQEQYPDESFLKSMDIVGYLGVPLFNSDQEPVGHVVALYKHPIPDEKLARVVIQLFTGRLGTELERRKISEQLTESTRLYESIVKNMNDYLIIFNPEGIVQLINDSARNIKYFESGSKHINFFTLLDGKHSEILKTRLARLSPEFQTVNFDWLTTLNDGQHRWIQWNIQAIFNDQGKLKYYETIGRDFTELKESEDARSNVEFMLHHAEKMSAIGELAGGVAHDFNNQLTSIKGYAELLINQLQNNPTALRYAENIYKASERSADITRQLLSFSRKKSPETTNLDLHDIVDEVFELVQHSVDKKLHLVKDLQAQPSIVTADSSQLQNAIMNLVINARDAIGEEGTITIATLNRYFSDEEFAERGVELTAGHYIQITVRDDGCGIDKEIMRRIFDPFFTTKEIGKGSGIGLTAVYNTFANHGGHIRVDSIPGEGSQFHGLLPCVYMALVPEETKKEETIKEQITEYRILLVDDEPMVLEVSSLMLDSLGHTVTACSEPQQAIKAFSDNPEQYDLVIVDMMMPHMTGKELFLALKEIKPDVIAAISSGYQMNESDEDLLAIGIKGFINKPFSLDNLNTNLTEIMSQ